MTLDNVPPFVVLDEATMQDFRTRLVNAAGDLAKAGLTTQDLRNVIYTKATHASPNVEIGQTEPKEPKVKGSKAKTLDTTQFDDMLG